MTVFLHAQAASTTCRPTIAADDGQLGDVKDLTDNIRLEQTS